MLAISSLASAEEVYIRNASYGKPGITNQYVVVTTTNNPDYYRYTNERFAYTIQVPRNFDLARSSANRFDDAPNLEHHTALCQYFFKIFFANLKSLYPQRIEAIVTAIKRLLKNQLLCCASATRFGMYSSYLPLSVPT